ncbi:MAG TPA: hypothetical protein VFL61_12295 [Gaiellaceae bacterium]|nr:hypothetical protein [Gaiellaceae bacterium]
MTEQQQDPVIDHTPGWHGSLQAAIIHALQDVPLGEPRWIERIWVQKKGNPIHEYRVELSS